jgi:hypothetical protein
MSPDQMPEAGNGGMDCGCLLIGSECSRKVLSKAIARRILGRQLFT